MFTVLMKKAVKKMGKKMNNELLLPMIYVDTREQKPYIFNKTKNCMGSILTKLDAGDYTIEGCEDLIRIERKSSVTELFINLGRERERFYNEIERMADIKYKFLVLEFSYADLLKGSYYSKISPNYIISNLMKLSLEHNIHVIYCGDRINAQDYSRRLLLKIWKYKTEGRFNEKRIAEQE